MAQAEANNDTTAQQLPTTWEPCKWWLEEGTNPRVKWCMENKEAILALHSSGVETNIFALECSCCKLWFKHCMFSKRERKSDWPFCRWCQTEKGIGTDPQQFEVDWHIHCNRSGKKICGTYRTLTPPTDRAQVKEAGIDDLPPPEVQFTVQKKMSQKERKAAQRAAKEAAGF